MHVPVVFHLCPTCIPLVFHLRSTCTSAAGVPAVFQLCSLLRWVFHLCSSCVLVVFHLCSSWRLLENSGEFPAIHSVDWGLGIPFCKNSSANSVFLQVDFPFCKMFGSCCSFFPDGFGVPCAEHFVTISVAVIYEARSLMWLMFFFGNIHFVRNYHFVVILLFVFFLDFAFCNVPPFYNYRMDGPTRPM